MPWKGLCLERVWFEGSNFPWSIWFYTIWDIWQLILHKYLTFKYVFWYIFLLSALTTILRLITAVFLTTKVTCWIDVTKAVKAATNRLASYLDTICKDAQDGKIQGLRHGQMCFGRVKSLWFHSIWYIWQLIFHKYLTFKHVFWHISLLSALPYDPSTTIPQLCFSRQKWHVKEMWHAE